MHRRTKACDISPAVKAEVWERDGGRCIFCGSPHAAPNMHYLSRAHGGLGIPQNIGTGCMECHDRLDNSTDRKAMLEEFKLHLQSKYPGWAETELTYKK